MSTNGSSGRFRVSVNVMLKQELADPQGSTVQNSTASLGWSNVSSVRVGKHFQLEVDGPSQEDVRRQVEEMCVRLLANPVIESYTVVSVEPL